MKETLSVLFGTGRATLPCAHHPGPYLAQNGFARILIQTGKTRDPRITDAPTIYELMNQYKTPESERRSRSL